MADGEPNRRDAIDNDAYRKAEAFKEAYLGVEFSQAAQERGLARFPEWQDISVRTVWGEIWSRPVLDVRTRSLCTIAALVALDRQPEQRIHMRGALRAGVTRAELDEVVIQMAIYAGWPVIASALRNVEEVAEVLGGQAPDG
jgi:alkylhydroperoxidase/carboxymuconolactone decarboxylase family protein YurZ